MPQKRIARQIRVWAPRFVGLLLLGFLLIRLDLKLVRRTFKEAKFGLVVASTLAVVPLILLKTIRWRRILLVQNVKFRIWPAFLAYFGSLFFGFLTPGRLGEFVKVLHVSQDSGVSSAEAFSSVLLDRLFDLYILLIVGSTALFSLTLVNLNNSLLIVVGTLLLFLIPLLIFLNEWTFHKLQVIGESLGPVGKKLFQEEGWLQRMRKALRMLTLKEVVAGTGLTFLAYMLFFGQCYLLALALDLHISFFQNCFAVALGSLVTLIPISVSGLGTREAVIVAYLGTLGVLEEMALSFSLLIFFTFYIGGGLMGSVAWLIKPIEIKRL